MTRSSSRRPGIAWHRSLYARVAIGFVLLIAIVLAVQGVIFIWLVGRSPQSTVAELTQALGPELSRQLDANSGFDLDERTSRLRPGEHVFVLMKDGRVSGSRRPPEETVRDVIAQLRSLPDGSDIPRSWRVSIYRAVPVRAHGNIVGVLGIVPRTTIERFGAEIAAIGVGLLIVGTLMASVLIFGPVRSRLRDLQRAAGRLGAGELTARARADGSDEVAELTRAFNSMAEELAKRAKALEASDRARRQLIADVSHELMTPLTTILGHLETLGMVELRLDEHKRQHHVAIATREAQRLERLIGDLLDTARLEAGGGDLDIQRIATHELFDEIVEHHEIDCRSRSIRFSCSVAPDAQVIHADPFRLEQAVGNVTANAVRHTPDGGLIELKAERAGDSIALTVTDSGEGIAPEHLPLIFDRFYKTNSVKGIASRGSGLGLSIVRAIVTRHGGRVSATSAVSVGTTIRLEFPNQVESAAERIALPSRSSGLMA